MPNDSDKRMKDYEKIFTSQKIVPHVPIILRIDGHNFHKYTKYCVRPFDDSLYCAFQEATKRLYKDLGNFELAYGQSDEVSILIYNPDTMTQERHNGKTFKLCSLVASMFTAYFNHETVYNKLATFDCRVFQLPINEVANYFIWRQKDATRNSIQMVGQANFSHRKLYGKSCSNIQDMLISKNINWNDIETKYKRGWCIKNGKVDSEIPIFTQNRKYIEETLNKE